MEGPVAHDVFSNFFERWNKQAGRYGHLNPVDQRIIDISKLLFLCVCVCVCACVRVCVTLLGSFLYPWLVWSQQCVLLTKKTHATFPLLFNT